MPPFLEIDRTGDNTTVQTEEPENNAGLPAEEAEEYFLDFEEGSVVHDVYVEMKAAEWKDSTIDVGYIVDYDHIDQLPKGFFTKYPDRQGKDDYVILDKEIYEGVLVCLGEQPDNELCQGWLARLQSSSPFQDRSTPFDRGVVLYARDLKLEAADSFQEFIDAHPKHVEHVDAHLGLGLSLYFVGELDQSERIFRHVIELDPTNTRAHQLLGDLFRYQKKFSQAEQAYSDLIKLDPRRGYPYNALCRMYWNQGDLEKAREIHSQQILNNPDSPYGYFFMGIIAEEQGKLDEAEHFYDRALEMSPNDQDYVSLGDTVIAWRYHPQYRRAYYRALEINPKNREVYSKLVDSLGWFEEDLPELQQVLERWVQNIPEDSKAYSKLGNVLHKQEKYAEEQQVLESWVQNRPEDSEAYGRLGGLLERQEKYAEAEKVYRDWLKHFPAYKDDSRDMPIALYHLVRNLEKQGKFAEIVGLIFDYREHQPDSKYSFPTLLGESLLELGRYPEALEIYEDLRQGYGEKEEMKSVFRAEHGYYYAISLKGVGRQDEAEEWFRIAAKNAWDVNHQIMARYALAEILREQGNEEEADRLEYEALGLLKENYFDR